LRDNITLRIITRRRLLASVLTAGSAAAYPVLVEPRWLELTHTRVPLNAQTSTVIRILQLSDFHASWAVPFSTINSAIHLGLSSNPDLICVTGDFITRRYDFDADYYVRVLKQLTASDAVFAVLGNHDGGIWAKERSGFPDHAVVERILSDAGITLLHNRSQQVEVRGRKLRLVGVGDLWANELNADRAFSGVGEEERAVLLSHNPDSKDLLGGFPWNLMLCGHTHGGQVIIPFEGPRYAPVVDKRFVAGLHGWNGRQIYTSRGVGNLGSLRFMCRPEVTVLDLEV
jgi:predicted MPP superfamily phosphohydrolase